MRIRRGPATVTGEHSPTSDVTARSTPSAIEGTGRGLEGRGNCGSGSQETLAVVPSSQGEDPE
ncbi:hypothetical protein Sm713_40600 [Streptomyces sp. TS71-3]|nr:hypothetical protein Sm713_40600 [Streptomyces sp. TS71-3]